MNNNTTYYITKYTKKDGTISTYKKHHTLKGTPKTGRPVATKTKLVNIIKKLSKEEIEKLYALVKMINPIEP